MCYHGRTKCLNLYLKLNCNLRKNFMIYNINTYIIIFLYSRPTLMPFQRIPEPQMPHNIYYNQNGFSAPPMNGQHLQGAGVGPANPMSPGMSSGGIPSPGPVMSRPGHVSFSKKYFELDTNGIGGRPIESLFSRHVFRWNYRIGIGVGPANPISWTC